MLVRLDLHLKWLTGVQHRKFRLVQLIAVLF